MNPAQFSVTVGSGGRTLVAIDDFSFALDEVTFLFGESGIGKSLLCKAAYGLLHPDELSVRINGNGYEKYLGDPRTSLVKEHGFFVFQEPSSHLNPLRRISEQLNEGSISGPEHEAEVLRRLWETGDDDAVGGILDVFPKPYRPSGGEKQRILLAMAFKKIARFVEQGQDGRAGLFVFDEPTGSLDNNYRNRFIRLLFEKYLARPFTILLITHDYSVISEVYQNYARLRDRIHFKELSRVDEEGRVALRDFSAQEYLNWLQSTQAGTAGGAGEAVLEFGNTFRVFGRNLRVYADEGHVAPTDLVVRRGEIVYLRAPSGVGKTTLAKVVMGLYDADQFTMKLCGEELTAATPQRIWADKIWGKRAGMVFQHADEALDLEATVRESFDGLPLKRKPSVDDVKGRLSELFEGPISDSFLRKKVKYLSGGQKQRLNLLRTLSLGTDLIILDEPLNALDFGSIRKVLGLLEQKRVQGAAFLVISHNEEIFEALVDRGRTYYLAETGE